MNEDSLHKSCPYPKMLLHTNFMVMNNSYFLIKITYVFYIYYSKEMKWKIYLMESDIDICSMNFMKLTFHDFMNINKFKRI